MEVMSLRPFDRITADDIQSIRPTVPTQIPTKMKCPGISEILKDHTESLEGSNWTIYKTYSPYDHYGYSLHPATNPLSYHRDFCRHPRLFKTHHCCSQFGTSFTHPIISCCRPDGSKDFRRAHHSETQQAQVEGSVVLSANFCYRVCFWRSALRTRILVNIRATDAIEVIQQVVNQ